MSIPGSVLQPGDFVLDRLVLTGATGNSENLDGFFSEINIYEDIFSNFIYGDVVISDSLNLVKLLPITGQETLYVSFNTPKTETKIEKTFRVFSMTDRKIARDTNTQVYRLNFCSQEGFYNNSRVIWKAYNGTISDVVQQIYDKNIKINTNLSIVSKTKNKAKFVGNGLTPYQVINWLTEKSQPLSGASCNFLFYETCQGAYFAAIEDLITKGKNIGKYTSAPAGPIANNYNDSMRRIISFDVSKTNDFLSSQLTGYLGSQAIGVDLIKKQFNINNYDYANEWSKYNHMEDLSFFQPTVTRNSEVVRKVFPIHPGLHNKVSNNLNEKITSIYGNRLSHIHEMTNFKLNMTIPGRTDIQIGNMIDVRIPDTNPPKSTDTVKDKGDVYSGKYMITAIRHKINPKDHSCIVELMRDSISESRD